MEINEKTTVNELFDEAKKLLADVPSGTEFKVQDLFRGYEWNEIPVGTRSRLGARFLIFAESEGISQVRIGEKSKQNQQIYIKK